MYYHVYIYTYIYICTQYTYTYADMALPHEPRPPLFSGGFAQVPGQSRAKQSQKPPGR